MAENNAGATPKKKTKKWFLLGIGSVATAVLSYFGIHYFNKHKTPGATKDETDITTSQAVKTKAPGKPAPKASTKPKAKATAKPKTAASTTKTDKVADQSSTAPDSAKTESKAPMDYKIVGAALHDAAANGNFPQALLTLAKLRSVDDYREVSKVFSSYRLNGVHQTLVNGMLSSFKNEKQQTAIRNAFIVMGLKHTGNKWSLSGTANNPLLITTRATTVWKNPKESVQVPLNMVLGKEIAKRGSFSLFESEGRYFLVESKAVNYYKS